MKNIKKATDAIREEMKKPIPEHQPQEEKKMATKKKSKKKKSRKVAKKGAAKKVNKKVKKKGGAKKARKQKKSVDGTTLAELAEEAGISGQKARQKLRSAGVEREKGSRWVFTNAKELKAARKALGL